MLGKYLNKSNKCDLLRFALIKLCRQWPVSLLWLQGKKKLLFGVGFVKVVVM